MSFKNKREIYQALVDGKKIKNKDWKKKDYFFLSEEGDLINKRRNNFLETFRYPSQWEEVKDLKKITLYRYTYKTHKNSIHQSNWSSITFEDYIAPYGRAELLKTESKEIEIEETR